MDLGFFVGVECEGFWLQILCLYACYNKLEDGTSQKFKKPVVLGITIGYLVQKLSFPIRLRVQQNQYCQRDIPSELN